MDVDDENDADDVAQNESDETVTGVGGVGGGVGGGGGGGEPLLVMVEAIEVDVAVAVVSMGTLDSPTMLFV